MSRIHLPHIPILTSALDNTVLKRRRESLILQTLDVSEAAPEIGLLPRRCGGCGGECVHRKRVDVCVQSLGSLRLDVIEEDFDGIGHDALAL